VRRRRLAAGRNAIWRPVAGGVTAPRGYQASGVAAGIKKEGPDLAVVFSTLPALGAALFTRNRVLAAPVVVSRKHLRRSRGRIRAVLVNSGCANACTGARGLRNAVASARALASRLGIDPYSVLVCSTGVIGAQLPISRLVRAVPRAVTELSPAGGSSASRAILTTDTRAKAAAFEAEIAGRRIRIGGMVKGSGMIHPQMATMLAVITTDAALARPALEGAFRRVVERTFNCLTVDGDTSTNDTVVVLANGASGLQVDASVFEAGLELVCAELARSVARDGEGATKFLEIVVRGAPSFEEARTVAKAIAHSPLVKTAFYGEELNWGRILCAAGYSGVRFDPDRITLDVCGVPVFRRGAPVARTRARAQAALRKRDLEVGLDLARGPASARVWTCDLSHGYVDINGSYIS
jgi:glutamate N-acetyltransferase/amino-acid N-acetyltransferase